MGCKDLSSIILAGGKSSRMGFDKAFLRLGDESLLENLIKRLKPISDEIIIVTDALEKFCAFAELLHFCGVKIVEDLVFQKGPLGGIYTGLKTSKNFYNFFVACDMPYIEVKLIKYLYTLREGYDVIVPRLKNGYETLFAIYSKDCIEPIFQTLKSDSNKVRDFFDKVKVREVLEEELKDFGDPEKLFMNINTKDDLCRITMSQKE